MKQNHSTVVICTERKAMNFHILTLFPEMVMQGLHTSIIGKAMQKGLLQIEAVDIRSFTEDRHGKVDDYPYGGGAGMLMQAQPVYDAYCSVEKSCQKKPRTIYVTPQGRTFSQELAEELSKEDELVILCGHYEGIDQRVLDEIVTDYVSIGDYVLTGGELPAMVMIDAISRLVPGVLHNDFSAETETFHCDLLEYPQYSRPEIWHDKAVPEVLLSGNHKKINAWRLQQSEERTANLRPDLFAKYRELQTLYQALSKKKRKYIHMMEAIKEGRCKLICHENGNVLLFEKYSEIYMIASLSEDCVSFLTKKEVQDSLSDSHMIVCCDKKLQQALKEQFSYEIGTPCYQACYTKKEPLPNRGAKIKPATEEWISYILEHYHENEEYIKDRIARGLVFGAFEEEKMVGFIGIHCEGSMGMLFVEEAYRRMGLAMQLETYLINQLLLQDKTPYCQIYEGNQPSFQLQERLGLYCCEEPMWWMWKEG